MRGRAGFFGGRNKNQMDRLLDGVPGRGVDESAILKKGGVNSREGVLLVAAVTSQMFFDQSWISCERVREIRDNYPWLFGFGRREIAHKMPVHEHESHGI